MQLGGTRGTPKAVFGGGLARRAKEDRDKGAPVVSGTSPVEGDVEEDVKEKARVKMAQALR